MNQLNTLKVVFVIIFFWCSLISYSQVNFPLHSQFKYLKGSEASGLGENWKSASFDDSNWSESGAPFRYGDGTGGTVLSDMQYNYSTVYLRASFNAAQVNDLNHIHFSVDYDDGVVVWINNQEVFRRNAPDILSYNAFAPDYKESGIPDQIGVDLSDIILNEGPNLIAVQGFNCNLESSDFYFDIEFSALPSLSTSSFISFSHASGFYNEPFDLILTSNDTSTFIIYTLDGSDPTTSASALNANNEVIINVDPSSIVNRPSTPAFIVRASLAKEGFASTFPKTSTCIFTESAKTQEHPGGDWPTYNINDQFIDLAMDPDVVNSPIYSDSIDDALLDIPSISISTDLDNLFDQETGIYVNAEGHGPEWERPCSFEIINPDGSEGFQINAGLRIRGGWSRHPEFPKHSLRLFFRSQYGESKLEYPLFEGEGISHFDKIDLRTSQNYAWANWAGEYNTMVRDIFCRDSQGAINQPYTRSRYYHLYLNGMYWGIYQTQERSEANYASDYFGGKDEDYDVIKINTEDFVYDVEATDGSEDTWKEIWNLCGSGFESNEDYFMLEGKNENGEPVKNSEILVDIDNLIDYMINIFYTGNFDSPTSSFGNNQGPNNYYAIFNHDDKSKGFVFFIHDAEHTLLADPVWPGNGIMENRVEPENMWVWDFLGFHPQWLHHKLAENSEYSVRFSDKAYEHLKGNGVFTPEKNKIRFNKRAKEVSVAIIAESARWGDTQSGTPFTKYNAWIPQIEDVNDKYFPYRTNVVIDQLKNAGLYSMVPPPVIKKGGAEIPQGAYYIENGTALTFENPGVNGEIYYTINGDDPRRVGGFISGSALSVQNGGTINVNTSALIKTRVFNGSSWSPVKTYKFLSASDDYSKLKVTELHYHPKDVIVGNDTISGKSFEFIEFLNVGETAVNLSGFKIESGVNYEFPDKTILPPKGFYVVVTKPKYFYEAYGMPVNANCDEFFSNSGEYILLTDSLGNEVLSFTYEDQPPWPEMADGYGYSLTASEKYPTGNPNDFNYWMVSSSEGGSPFAFDSLFAANEDAHLNPEVSIKVYPNPVVEVVSVKANIPGNEEISLFIHDGFGRLVYNKVFSERIEINFNSLGLSPGIYIISCESHSFRNMQKIIYTP